MNGMQQFQNFGKSREQHFLDNQSAYPDLHQLWQVDKEKAINAMISHQSILHYLSQYRAGEVEKVLGLSEKIISEAVKRVPIKSGRGKIFSDMSLITPDDAIYYCERVNTQMTQEEIDEIEKEMIAQGVSNTAGNIGYVKVDIRVAKRRFSSRPNPYTFDFHTFRKTLLSCEFTEEQIIEILSGVLAIERDTQAISVARKVVSTILSLPNLDQKIFDHIDSLGSDMYDAVGRGFVNILLVHPDLVSWFETNCSMNMVNDNNPGIKKIGLVDNMYDLYTSNVGLQQGEIFCIYKNQDEATDFSMVFGTLQELVVSLDYPQFTQQDVVCKTDDILIIEKNFIKKIEIKN